MGKAERIVVYSILGVLFVWLLILTVSVGGALGEINDNLMALAGGPRPAADAGDAAPGEAAGDEGWWGSDAGSGEEVDPLAPTPVGAVQGSGSDVAQIGIAGLQVLTGSVEMTLTVRAYGAGDLLYEPPVLATEEGQTYQITGESLESSRIAFLDLVTSGQATTRFVFSARLSPTKGLWLVFNPNQPSGSAIAPPMRVPVPLRTGVGGQ
jgi:hypothetical protein